MKQTALQFGLLALAFFAFMQITKYTLFTRGLAEEAWTVFFAFSFLGIGLWLSRRFWPAKPLVNSNAEKVGEESTKDRSEQVKTIGISKRELEVLELIAQGCSNQEIAGQLFISESTVKSHVSKLLAKLDAQRRTQAVSKARKLGIL